MKFEPTQKLIAGFNIISFATVLLLLLLFVIITSQLNMPVVEKTEPKTETVNKIEPQVTQPELKKDTVKVEKSVKVEPVKPLVNENSIIKKADVKEKEIPFELSFEGKAIRRIRSYLLPDDDGSESAVKIIKLNFTIKPDGSVGKVYPEVKTNTRLELIAMGSLRQWRFEPLKKTADQEDQLAVITFLRR